MPKGLLSVRLAAHRVYEGSRKAEIISHKYLFRGSGEQGFIFHTVYNKDFKKRFISSQVFILPQGRHLNLTHSVSLSVTNCSLTLCFCVIIWSITSFLAFVSGQSHQDNTCHPSEPIRKLSHKRVRNRRLKTQVLVY